MIKKIYIFWYQGINNSPIIVKKCILSWVYYNQDWEIIILDKTNYHIYTDLRYKNNMTFYRFSDFLRLSILQNYGGLWVDATCFCNDSLDKWLTLFINERFFVFNNLTPINKKISNWFIYSEKGHYMIEKWKIKSLEYFNDFPKQFNDNYFIFHDIFEDLCNNDPQFSSYYDKIPKNTQNDYLMYFNFDKRKDLYIESKGFLSPVTEEIKNMIVKKEKYLFKLSHKCILPSYEELNNSILYYLFSTIDTKQI
jgi:mannosyltransferase OCH1-like enzyme